MPPDPGNARATTLILLIEILPTSPARNSSGVNDAHSYIGAWTTLSRRAELRSRMPSRSTQITKHQKRSEFQRETEQEGLRMRAKASDWHLPEGTPEGVTNEAQCQQITDLRCVGIKREEMLIFPKLRKWGYFMEDPKWD